MKNNLVSLTKEEEEGADDLLSSLTTLAYEKARPVAKTDRKFKSRFFFRIQSLGDELKIKAEKFKPRKLDHVDAEINKRLTSYKKEAPKKVERGIEAVREFFLKEIGPKTLAGLAGSTQARDIVQRLLGTAVDETQFNKFERMSHEAVNIKMAQFLARYYGLPRSEAERLLLSIQPKPYLMMPLDRGQDEQRNTKESKKQKTSS